LCDVEEQFLTDYERENPATADRAREVAVQRAEKRHARLMEAKR
jgi:hypothetical protein